jgi:hypothetical protein
MLELCKVWYVRLEKFFNFIAIKKNKHTQQAPNHKLNFEKEYLYIHDETRNSLYLVSLFTGVLQGDTIAYYGTDC